MLWSIRILTFREGVDLQTDKIDRFECQERGVSKRRGFGSKCVDSNHIDNGIFVGYMDLFEEI